MSGNPAELGGGQASGVAQDGAHPCCREETPEIHVHISLCVVCSLLCAPELQLIVRYVGYHFLLQGGFLIFSELFLPSSPRPEHGTP